MRFSRATQIINSEAPANLYSGALMSTSLITLVHLAISDFWLPSRAHPSRMCCRNTTAVSIMTISPAEPGLHDLQ